MTWGMTWVCTPDWTLPLPARPAYRLRTWTSWLEGVSSSTRPMSSLHSADPAGHRHSPVGGQTLPKVYTSNWQTLSPLFWLSHHLSDCVTIIIILSSAAMLLTGCPFSKLCCKWHSKCILLQWWDFHNTFASQWTMRRQFPSISRRTVTRQSGLARSSTTHINAPGMGIPSHGVSHRLWVMTDLSESI